MSDLLREIEAKLADMSPEQKEALRAKVQSSASYNPLFTPNAGPQTEAYNSPADITYYGGAAGGG